MPIDYRKYPKNWKTEIRPAILKRADNKCEFCQIRNYRIFHKVTRNCMAVQLTTYKDARGYLDSFNYSHRVQYGICVLIIAHLDHDINNNEPENLRALCQKCHNNHDKEYRAANRKSQQNATP